MKVNGKLNHRTLLCYSDILFDDVILHQLLKRDDDILLVVDPSFKKVAGRSRKLDLIKTKNKPLMGKRIIPQRSNPVLEIGKNIPKTEADYEFIGIALFSQKGIENFKKEYVLAKKKYKNSRFHGATSFSKADITDLLNEMIGKGYTINVLEIHSGWIEIHTFENYKSACCFVG